MGPGQIAFVCPVDTPGKPGGNVVETVESPCFRIEAGKLSRRAIVSSEITRQGAVAPIRTVVTTEWDL